VGAAQRIEPCGFRSHPERYSRFTRRENPAGRVPPLKQKDFARNLLPRFALDGSGQQPSKKSKRREMGLFNDAEGKFALLISVGFLLSISIVAVINGF
jgi:hypothetical protein